MHHYPQFLTNKNLINVQVVFPGGWSQDVDKDQGIHFLWEHLLFAPTPNFPDPDEYLWDHCVDFWSVTSFESIRLNFTLEPEQVTGFSKILAEMIQPRTPQKAFLAKEIQDLKHFWQTDRDTKEDQAIRQLFPGQNVVHPNPELINNLSEKDLDEVLNYWQKAQPFCLILGALTPEQVLPLGQVFPTKTKFYNQTSYLPPQKAETFTTRHRWGAKFELQGSHFLELLLIELWDQVFGAKFFFEYHQDQLFIWTNPIEDPQYLATRLKAYQLTKKDFEHAQSKYLQFLETLYQADTSTHLEKLSELIEGLHGHEHQAPTFGIHQKNLDLREVFKAVDYSTFHSFYQGFIKALPA